MLCKTICGCLLICTLFSCCSHPEPQKPDENENKQDNISFISVMLGDKCIEEWEENNIVKKASWTNIKLSDGEAEKFPKLESIFNTLNSNALSDAKTLLNELTESAEFLEGDENNPVYLEEDSKIFMQRADTKIVSYLKEVYQYFGGAHPNYFYIASNYNSKTGETLALTDVMTSVETLPNILEQKICDKYKDVNFGEKSLSEIFKEYSADDYNWSIDYQGITFWFSPYDIASFAVGGLNVKIYFEDEPELFEKEYRISPSEKYALTLPVHQELDFDLNLEDGKKDCIEIAISPDEYGSYNILSVTVNGKTFTDEINYAYDFDVYLAHVGDKNYIYSDSVSDNDYHVFCTWDINGDTPRKIHELSGTEIDCEYVEEGFEEGTVYKAAFNNPESFILEKRFNILGTRGATATFKSSETDGIPEMTENIYTFNEGESIMLKIPLEAEILPDMKKEKIAKGTNLTPYQTDGKTFVDLKTEEGRVVRFKIDVSGFPVTVNGTDETECFENIFYAG